jgi:hypothetical protein
MTAEEEYILHAPENEFLAWMKLHVHGLAILTAIRQRLYTFAGKRNDAAYGAAAGISYRLLDWDPDVEEWEAWVERIRVTKVIKKLEA